MTEGECSQLRSLLAQSETIVLCCHQNADGDALGAILGMGEVLRQMGKAPVMVAPDQYPDYLQWLPNSEKIVRYDKRKDYVDMVLKIADLIICLDFNTLARTDQMEEALKASPAKKVLIDHHLDPDVDAVVKVSRPQASSTCELVFRVVWQMGLFDELGKHFAYEEDNVFTYVRSLMDESSPYSGDYSITQFEEHHENVEEKLEDMKNIVMKYLPSECDNTVKTGVLFSIYQLQDDLQHHTYVENNVLVPIVTRLEKHGK